ncbi:MAG: Holliday junction resolvase RuvX [Hyphomicrobium sp.]|nr:Holliday junction resolvase RuvX [Hyphomicrobium sp.]
MTNDHDNADTPPYRTSPPAGATYFDADAFAAKLEPGARLIGIDAGTKTLGLALSDVTRTIASALDTIRRTKFTADAEYLLDIADSHNCGGFVLGFPAHLDGSEGPRAQATRAFARNVNKLSPLPILLWDERMSTVAAERILLEADTSRKRRAELIDKIAATVILQGALDRMQRTGNAR